MIIDIMLSILSIGVIILVVKTFLKPREKGKINIEENVSEPISN